MFNKIFRSIFFTSFAILLICFSFTLSVLFDYFEEQMFTELGNEANYIARIIEIDGTSYIDSFDNKEKRITLVSADGTVLADTDADTASLDNHSSREEIKEALSEGKGTSSRYSSTLMQKTLYYAEKLNNGTILRVSATQSSVVVVLLGLLQPIIFITAVALFLALFLAHRVSTSIIKPINELDLENPSANEAYEELTPLLKKLSAQKKTIDRQIKQAHQKQEEFKLITENMSEGLLVIDKDFNVLSYNSAAVKLLEIGNEISGSVLTLNRSRGFRNAAECALSGKRTECDISHGENTYSLIASPVYDSKKIIGAVIVIIDITESAKRELLRREFTSNVSHELKTPLTSISGFAEMMKSGGVNEADVIDFSTSVYDEAQRLISLVSDIMKLSELDEGATQFEQVRLNLYAVANDVVCRLKPVADKQNVKLSVIGDSAYISGNKRILDEMIYNLCDNAIKYNKPNGSVEILVEESGGDAALTVKDTGIGIPQSEQARIFERFYRVDKSRSSLVGGTGLGLAIVKHGAAYHDAEISLESVEGQGTKITVTFKKAE